MTKEEIKLAIKTIDTERKVESDAILAKYNYAAMHAEMQTLFNEYDIQRKPLVIALDELRKEIK